MDGSPKEYYNGNPRRTTSSPNPSYATTSVHVTALDGLINVHFLFTIAVFVRKYMHENPALSPKEYYNGNPRRTTSSSNPSYATTSVHVTALDGLVNVNSLFTIAVFVGLSLTTPGQHSLENPSACDASADVAKKLLVFEVVAFSFFLFSSLVAQGLKLAINLLNSKDVDEIFRAHISLKVLRFGMMGSAVGSVMGCLFLMLLMVNVIQIRLGTLSCGSKSTVHAVAALIFLVTSALIVYISTAIYAFLH